MAPKSYQHFEFVAIIAERPLSMMTGGIIVKLGTLDAKMTELHEITHYWFCDGDLEGTSSCEQEPIKFRQPQLPQHLFESEFNESKECPCCGAEMYFCDEEEH